MAILEVKGLKKSFGAHEVLKGIDFELERGEVLAIIGSSGSGKTTLLRCLNFLETADERFKISLRSKGETDVNAIARVYGGGGHVQASGCMISGCLEEVIDKLRYTIKQHLQD